MSIDNDISDFLIDSRAQKRGADFLTDYLRRNA
jgi:hypothetical protein